MAEIIKERHRVKKVDYSRDFCCNGRNFNEGGCSFPCNENGNLLENLTIQAIENFHYCINHPEKYKDMGIKKSAWSYMENAKLKCDCGEVFELYNEYLGACECPKCSRWFNLFGQEVNNPETWKDGDDW